MAYVHKAQPNERLRQARALELRLEGKRWAEIAAELGYSDHTGALRAVDAALDRHESPNVEAVRKLQDARLEALYERSWSDAMAGDEKAREYVLKLHDRKVKLHGANMPEKMVVAAAISAQQSSGMTAEEFRDVVLELQRTHPARPRPGYVPEPLPPGTMPRWEDDAYELGFDPHSDTPVEEWDEEANGPWANI